MSEIGHNSGGNLTGLQSYIERIEHLEAEKELLAVDIRDIYTEAKGSGLDVKIMRQVIRIRKKDAAKQEEEEALLDTYLRALGMLADTPLGLAAIEREFGNAA